jgi:malate synthase
MVSRSDSGNDPGPNPNTDCSGYEVLDEMTETVTQHARLAEILSAGALEFLADLHARFADRRDELLAARGKRREEAARTGRLDFLADTAEVRSSDWTVASAPADLLERRVEITGPTQPKMAINALNSGANVWLADLEDANTPHWYNVIDGQAVLSDVTRRALHYTGPDGKEYRLRTDTPLAVVIMRPRGWHLDEEHLEFGGRSAIGALVDFGLYFYHNAAELLARGSGPYFYLPKMESHLEARLWNDVFLFAQSRLDIPRGSVRATALIETIPAAFEMEEILFELREHASGLNAGRWDYLFSMIKYFRDAGPEFVLPDRNDVTMSAPFMDAYTRLLVRTCHRRGAYAIGGMAAFIPSRRDPKINEAALTKVRADKVRESAGGFDGSWVAHPDLVPICDEVFTAKLDGQKNQVSVIPAGPDSTVDQLLDVSSAPGGRTEQGLRNNVTVALNYLAVWLSGNGAVAINNLMEDTATAEICRAQIWQQINAGVVLDTGEEVTTSLVERFLEDAVETLRPVLAADESLLPEARRLFEAGALASEFPDFLTLDGYQSILARERAQ